MRYLIRLSQSYEDFRLAELEALAELHNVELNILDYSKDSVYELWGTASDYEKLHDVLKSDTVGLWPLYKSCSFKFAIDTFRGSRSSSELVAIVESFSYMAFEGKIRMKSPDQEFCVFEEYDPKAPVPKRVLFGRLLGHSARDDVFKFSLKTRKYIATTSMDAELALIGSNLALAAPGRLFYDPFVGTGSLTIACSHHGAVTVGSDLDGRTIRGKRDNNLRTSYAQYGLSGRYLDGFASDLTHSPLRLQPPSCHRPLFDGIVCDPPYGVREGLKVLGSAEDAREVVGVPNSRTRQNDEDYVPYKRPYSFEAMLVDILEFAASALVIGGRLSFWMPTANEDERELQVPLHPALEVVSVCVQPFNKWSRKLITYRRRRNEEVEDAPLREKTGTPVGQTADELNSFRKRYFEGFRTANNSSTGQDTRHDGDTVATS